MANLTAEAEDLPKAIVRRVVKEKLSQLDGVDLNIHKDALLAFGESARIFIHYLSATANDVCKESKRLTINADDVFKALEEIEFPEFIGPLQASLDDFRQKNAGKKAEAAKSKEENKKRKAEEEPAKEDGNEENGAQDVEEEANGDKSNMPVDQV